MRSGYVQKIGKNPCQRGMQLQVKLFILSLVLTQLRRLLSAKLIALERNLLPLQRAYNLTKIDGLSLKGERRL